MNFILLLGKKKKFSLATEIRWTWFVMTKDINEDGLRWKNSLTSNQWHLPEVITATLNCEHSPAKLLTCHNQITSLKVNPIHLYIPVDRNNKKSWEITVDYQLNQGDDNSKEHLNHHGPWWNDLGGQNGATRCYSQVRYFF